MLFDILFLINVSGNLIKRGDGKLSYGVIKIKMGNKIVAIIVMAIQLMIVTFSLVAENLDSQDILFLHDPPFWEGTVNLIRNTTFEVTAFSSGNSYIISSTTALGALHSASKMGNFGYTIDDQWYDQFGSLLLDSIAEIKGEGLYGWQYRVNYPNDSIPYVGADQYQVKEGDVVDFFYGDFDVTPNSSSMLIRIHVQIKEDTSPPRVIISRPTNGFYILDRKIIEFSSGFTIVVNQITIKADVFDELTDVNRVEFFIDTIQYVIDEKPSFEWTWNQTKTGRYTLHIKGYDEVGNHASDEKILWILSV